MDEQYLKKIGEDMRKWAESQKGKYSLSAQQAKDGEALKKEVIKIFESEFSRDSVTGKFKDPVMATLEEAFNRNSDAMHEKLAELVYKGKLDPIDIYEGMSEVAGADSELQKLLLAIKDKDAVVGGCEYCAICALCAICGYGCSLCFLSGIVAAAATITIAASASAASAA